MKLRDYQAAAMRTAKDFGNLKMNLHHAVFGVATEVGEFLTPVKRMVIYGVAPTGEIKANLIEELGDLMWYCALAADNLNMDLEELFAKIKDKVRAKWAHFLDGLHQEGLLLFIEAGRFAMHAEIPTGAERMYLEDCLKRIVGQVYALSVAMNVDFEYILDENIAKLKERYPDKYSDLAAEARADKGGEAA